MAEKDEQPRLGISAAQVAGSALAAISGAVFASMAGTTGTIIGAGIGSVIATVGAASYTWWLRHTGDAVRRRAAQVRRTALAHNALPRTVSQGPMRADGRTRAQPTPAEAAAEDQQGPEDDGPSRFPWAKVALAAAVVMVIAVASLTLFEALTGRPVSSYTGGSDQRGTTVGDVVREQPRRADPTDQPEQPTPSEQSTPSPPAQSPAESPPTTVAPTPSAPEPTAPGSEPTAPVESPPPS